MRTERYRLAFTSIKIKRLAQGIKGGGHWRGLTFYKWDILIVEGKWSMTFYFVPNRGGDDEFLKILQEGQATELVKMDNRACIKDDRLDGRRISLFHTGPTPRPLERTSP